MIYLKLFLELILNDLILSSSFEYVSVNVCSIFSGMILDVHVID